MKRVFALVVCLCMVFAMVPAASAATGDVSLNGNAIYNTVEEALAAAVAGDTVTLNADVTAGQVIVPKNVTLDLGGYNLTADLVIAMNGEISGQGNVVVAEDMLKIIGNNGGKLAVWDSENGTYVFAEPTYNQLMNVAEDLSYANYIFVPYLDEATTAMLADGGADNGISVKVLLTWNEGASQQIYTFSDDLVSQVYGGNYALVFQLTITGFAGIEDMTACAVVESAAGGKAANVESAVALPQEPEVETSGSIEIESYGNSEWTAPQDGYVKFTINIPGAQLAVLNGFSPLAEGIDSVTVQVTADTVYGVYPAFVDTACVVTWEYVDAPAGGDEGGSGGDVEVVPSGEALALGDNNVTLAPARVPMEAPYWTYTATENGNLTVTVSSINGDSNLDMAFGRGMYTLLVGETDGAYTNTATVYMNEGETVNIAVLDTLDAAEVPAVINLSFAAGEPVVEKNPADYFDTDENGYYVIGSLESPVDIFVGNDDINYIYVAEKAGTVTVTATVDEMTATNCWIKVNDGGWDYFANPAAVVEGDVVIINIWQGYEGTVSLEAGAVEPEPSEPEVPAEPDGTQANPFVIDVLPYSIEFFGGMDQYYTYTAEADGTIIVTALEGAILSLPNGEEWDYDAEGNYAIPVTAGYELVLNPWTMQPELSGSMVISYQVNEEPVETEPVETEATEPAADSVLSIEEAIALGASKEHNTYTTNKYYVTGVITEVYNVNYGNMYIADDAGNTFTIYGTYSADGSIGYSAMAIKPVAGDTVTIYGSIGQYNGTPQIKNGWITDHIDVEVEETTEAAPDPEANTTLSVEEAIALGASKAHNTYTTGKYYVTGEITEVYNTTYGNMRIKDEAGNILTVYGTYDADGTNRYDVMAVKPVAGDTVTVYGIIGQYGGTPQMKNGWIVAHTAAVPEETEATEPVETEPVETEPADPNPAETTVSKSVADLITEYGWDGTTTKQSFTLDDVVSVKINGGNNSGKAYYGEQIRIYATDSPAGTMTISVSEGYELVSVKITTQTGTYAFLCVDGTTEDICNTTTAVSGTSVVLNSVKNGSDGKQVRVTAIEVTYK